MRARFIPIIAAALAIAASVASARAVFPDTAALNADNSVLLPPYLQCVPYARQVTGIQIYGDAWTWWAQAEGRYARGFWPKVGAVMALRPHGNSHLGHVAAVSRIIDERTILIRHANWSPINGRRGQIEDNVKVIDVSSATDWSEVRVGYAPIQALGGSVWPVQGFIYRGKPPKISPNIDKVKLRGASPASLLPPQYANAPTKRRAAKASRSPIGDIIGKKMGW